MKKTEEALWALQEALEEEFGVARGLFSLELSHELYNRLICELSKKCNYSTPTNFYQSEIRGVKLKPQGSK